MTSQLNDFLAHMPACVLVTGIGTDVGKSVVTGWIARELMHYEATHGKDPLTAAITQKLIQTGNRGMSEDIEMHRRITGTGLLPRDLDHTTAPLILSYPCSPELAARIDGVVPDFNIAKNSTKILAAEFDHVLVEGAGGLLVPLRKRYTTLDYICEEKLPVIVVTNGQLGSINHTLLTLEALRVSKAKVYAVVYNTYFDSDPVIAADTADYISDWLGEFMPEAFFVKTPSEINHL